MQRILKSFLILCSTATQQAAPSTPPLTIAVATLIALLAACPCLGQESTPAQTTEFSQLLGSHADSVVTFQPPVVDSDELENEVGGNDVDRDTVIPRLTPLQSVPVPGPPQPAPLINLEETDITENDGTDGAIGDPEDIAAIRARLNRIADDYERRLRELQRTDVTDREDTQRRMRNYESTLEAYRRQLEKRVPSYQSLPTGAQQQLLQEIQDRQLLEKLVNFHGYARVGAGTSGRGSDQEIFRLTGVPTKYRLGNENDTYIEIIMDRTRKLESGATIRGEFMVAYQTSQDVTYDPNDVVVLREAFMEFANLPAVPDWSFWIGNRYYDRHDIHIIDFFFLDVSGYGGGVEDIGIGDAKLSIAYLSGALSTPETDQGRLAKHNLDMRLHDIPMPIGKLMLWGFGSAESGGTTIPGNEYEPPKSGYAVGAIHLIEDVLGGFNKSSIMWGRGAASNFTTTTNQPFQPEKLFSQFLLTETFTVQPCEWLALQGTAVYRETYQDTAGRPQVRWVSGGFRPIFMLTEHGALAFEYGADYIHDNANYRNGSLHKFTISPMLRVGNNFFARPELRTFVTWAWWGEQFEGLIGGPSYVNRTDGLSAGVQLESWW